MLQSYPVYNSPVSPSRDDPGVTPPPPSVKYPSHRTKSDSFDLTPTERTHLIEQRRLEHESIRLQHIHRFEEEMQQLDMRRQQDEEEFILRLANPGVVNSNNNNNNNNNNTRPVSEPTTPPDSLGCGSNNSSITTHHARLLNSGTGHQHSTPGPTPTNLFPNQLITPPSEETITSSRQRSSRHRSPSDDESSNLYFPMEGLSLVSRSDGVVAGSGLKYIFDDSSSTQRASINAQTARSSNPSPKAFLQVDTTDDKFPILVRRESFHNSLDQHSDSLWPPSFANSGRTANAGVFAARVPGANVFQNDNSGSPFSSHVKRSSFDYRGSANGNASLLSGPKSVPTNTGGSNNMKGLSDRSMSFNVPMGGTINENETPPSVPNNHQFGMNMIYPQQYPRQQQQTATPATPSSFPPPGHQYSTPKMPLPSSNLSSQMAGPNGTPPHPMRMNGAMQPCMDSNRPNMSGSALKAGGSNVPVASNNNPASNAPGKRQIDMDVINARFANVSMESLASEIYFLCKDQHGCRFLQKKLEEKNPAYNNMIFEETYKHVVELMTDPFGNYLCQKLLEFSNDNQRTILVQTASTSLVKIALNQHGTRALQRMIEFVSTSQQIGLIVDALKTKVVELIQDLNGNHVIQKCLNRLSNQDAQFIFDAVSDNCVAVGTHRHGCCVLQRCIDHASPRQKDQLVKEITSNAITLVRDPFGNYVTQYVLDLGEVRYSDPLMRQFVGNIYELSMQKFSSNVIEKCIRLAEPNTRTILIDEILCSPGGLEKLLRDSYANYVIQTAFDFASPEVRHQLVEAIRPILPLIRNTPYGRRIQSKILGSSNNGVQPQPVQQQPQHARHHHHASSNSSTGSSVHHQHHPQHSQRPSFSSSTTSGGGGGSPFSEQSCIPASIPPNMGGAMRPGPGGYGGYPPPVYPGHRRDPSSTGSLGGGPPPLHHPSNMHAMYSMPPMMGAMGQNGPTGGPSVVGPPPAIHPSDYSKMNTGYSAAPTVAAGYPPSGYPPSRVNL